MKPDPAPVLTVTEWYNLLAALKTVIERYGLDEVESACWQTGHFEPELWIIKKARAALSERRRNENELDTKNLGVDKVAVVEPQEKP